MIIRRHFTDVEETQVADGVTMRVVVGPDDGAPHFNLRVFEVKPGRATFHHEHWWEHEIFILEGAGTVATQEGEKPIGAGYTMLVPGGEKHQIRNTGEGVLRFICLVPQDWLGEIERS
ncbi:MAG: cupin domain-containing protein [Bacillota bacterium]